MTEIDVNIRQRSVFEFVNAKDEIPICIYERLKIVCGDTTVDVSYNEVERQIPLADEKQSDKPLTAVTPCNKSMNMVRVAKKSSSRDSL
ncbi:hypothetical protein Trydic_g21702 [Trypoxylus dichotomus]